MSSNGTSPAARSAPSARWSHGCFSFFTARRSSTSCCHNRRVPPWGKPMSLRLFGLRQRTVSSQQSPYAVDRGRASRRSPGWQTPARWVRRGGVVFITIAPRSPGNKGPEFGALVPTPADRDLDTVRWVGASSSRCDGRSRKREKGGSRRRVEPRWDPFGGCAVPGGIEDCICVGRQNRHPQGHRGFLRKKKRADGLEPGAVVFPRWLLHVSPAPTILTSAGARSAESERIRSLLLALVQRPQLVLNSRSAPRPYRRARGPGSTAVSTLLFIRPAPQHRK